MKRRWLAAGVVLLAVVAFVPVADEVWVWVAYGPTDAVRAFSIPPRMWPAGHLPTGWEDAVQQGHSRPSRERSRSTEAPAGSAIGSGSGLGMRS